MYNKINNNLRRVHSSSIDYGEQSLHPDELSEILGSDPIALALKKQESAEGFDEQKLCGAMFDHRDLSDEQFLQDIVDELDMTEDELNMVDNSELNDDRRGR